MNNQLQRLTRLAEILGRDRRYKLEAYLFVIEALHYELKRLGVDSPDKRKEDFVGVFDFDRDLVNAYPLGDASKD